MSLEIFEGIIESVIGESIESIRNRPLEPRKDLESGKFGIPPRLAVPIYNSKTCKYTNNFREIFPDTSSYYDDAMKRLSKL
ncbi:MAG: hypothetical protein WC867_00695 [Candidatus Pacearchaeota archaeon]|jgi:hypothetical protein